MNDSWFYFNSNLLKLLDPYIFKNPNIKSDQCFL